MPEFYSTTEIAELFHQPPWRVQRLFEDGELPEPERFAGKRAIPGSMLPALIEAMRRRGWISKVGEAGHVG